MATRQIVSRSELDAWLTAELQKVEDCHGSLLTVKYLLREPDPDGCNWSDVNLRPGPNTTAEQAFAIATGIVGRARSMFNVAE